jgi:protein phosphatase
MKPAVRSAFGHTHVGQRRDSNQDNYLCLQLGEPDPRGFLLAVADGMGGHAGGEVASEIAIGALREHMMAALSEPLPSGTTPADLLIGAFEAANRDVLTRAEKNPDLFGMGTTMVAGLTYNGVVHLANVGDSRAYVLNDDGIRQITRDHTWGADEVARGELSQEEVDASPFAGMITRSVGSGPEIDVDTFEFQLQAGDYLMMCSDGVYREVDDSGILATVMAAVQPERGGRRLIDAANAAGGADNITCVLAGPAGGETHRDTPWDTTPMIVRSPAANDGVAGE